MTDFRCGWKPPIRPVHVVSFRADAGMAAGAPPRGLGGWLGFHRQPRHPRGAAVQPVAEGKVTPTPTARRLRAPRPYGELVHADYPAVAQGVDRIEPGLDRDPASPTAAPVKGRHNHAVSSVDEFLGGLHKLFPRALPTLKLVSNRIQPMRRSILDGGVDDVGINRRQRLGAVSVSAVEGVEGPLHDLEVLLRHRLRERARPARCTTPGRPRRARCACGPRRRRSRCHPRP